MHEHDGRSDVSGTLMLSPTATVELSGVRPPLQQRMHHYFEASCDRTPEGVALAWEGGQATYAELDALANAVAHHLRDLGVREGGRVALLIPRSLDMYVALLGIMKAGAAFVPIDPASPADRVDYIATDSGAELVLSCSALDQVLADVDAQVIRMDDPGTRAAVADAPRHRPTQTMLDDPTAYIIYTSGSSGRPKGVDVAQHSICNFIHVITEVYDVRPTDRVYQGMTIAFDFAIEEVWPTWAVGAMLVAGPTDARRVGVGLTEFLEKWQITLLYCVPTVLSTVERTIPGIRGLMVGGEACPSELVERWAPGRRMLNTYGPTEATVTCTWGVLLPGRAVTIGVPVPTYTAMILDEDRNPVPDGEVGELCIGGPGVARGYLNRGELTRDRFIEHPSDPSQGRVYRTGDLARIQEDGEIVYLGRADAEVKIRGHRVDLGEIESVLMRDPMVPTAAVKPLKGSGTGDELAAYLTTAQPLGPDQQDELLQRLHATARELLPGYMVPAYLEVVTEVPMLPSGKVDRNKLPDPISTRLIASSGEYAAPADDVERWMVGVWADAFGVDAGQLSVDADFFDDLGGHSLVAATMVSTLRKDPRGSGLSVMDLYAAPSVRALAEKAGQTEPGVSHEIVPVNATRSQSGLRVWRFGLAQLLFIFGFLVLAMSPISLLYWWYEGRPTFGMLQVLLVTFPANYLVIRWLAPVAIARFVGRGITEGWHELYGWTHLRVWMVGKAMELSPMSNLAGSAFAPGFLRLAGADIHPTAHLGTALVPLPSMLTMEESTTVGYATYLEGWSITQGRLRVGRVHLVHGSTVAANSVLTGPCQVGEAAVLREQSSLGAGGIVPADQAWGGSPARALESVGDPVFELMAGCHKAPKTWSHTHRVRFAWGLAALELAPLAAMLPIVVLVWWVLLRAGAGWALGITAMTGPVFVLTVCALVLALRRFGLPRTPVGVHHLHSSLGVEKWFADKLLETSLLLTNTLYSTLYTTSWLRLLGAKIGASAEVSTIANVDPDLLSIGDESFIADMASVGSATYCNHHVAFRPTTIAPRAFVGNASFVPSGTFLGSESLLGVASVPPGPVVKEGTSWLGSPAFYLPRREVFEDFTTAQTFHPPRHRIITRYLIEAVRIIAPSTVLAMSTFVALYLASLLGREVLSWWAMVLLVPAAALVCSVGVVLVCALTKWVLMGRYRPRVEPLWSMFVRRSELVTGLFEAAAVPALLMMLQGTPWLGPALRLFGVKVGARALIATTYVTEFDLVSIGRDCYIGPAVSLQTHLFEDRVMKMGKVEIDRSLAIETRSVVLYGTHVGRGSQLAPLSLVMKGESIPPLTGWAGVPAQPARRALPLPAATELAHAEHSEVSRA